MRSYYISYTQCAAYVQITEIRQDNVGVLRGPALISLAPNGPQRDATLVSYTHSGDLLILASTIKRNLSSCNIPSLVLIVN